MNTKRFQTAWRDWCKIRDNDERENQHIAHEKLLSVDYNLPASEDIVKASEWNAWKPNKFR